MHPALLALALLLHAAAGSLVVVGGLIMPAWAVSVLGAVWVGLLVVIVLKRRQAAWAFLMPLVSIGLWFAAAFLGDAFLDWTA
jgi:hypothetical protein